MALPPIQLSQDQTECLRGQYLRHTSGFKRAGAVSFGVWDDQHPDQRPLPSHDISEIPQETDKVGDTDQTLLMALYTGSCGSAMCPEISVPKCHDERVNSGADDPISGEVCLDCAFIQACNTTQGHEARSEQVGGAFVSSRKRVEGCSALFCCRQWVRNSPIERVILQKRATELRYRFPGVTEPLAYGYHASALLLTALFQVNQRNWRHWMRQF